MKILHIAVHLGGGVGTVLRNWIKKDNHNEHNILLLNRNFYGSNEDNIYENFRHKYDEINVFVKKSDIVIIHFWNHPYLFEFLVNINLEKCRLCIWSHCSGLFPPYVHTKNLLSYPDNFYYSSPICGENYIWTTGGIEEYLNINRNLNDKEFRVGYIGTLDYSKLNPYFLLICKSIYHKIPNVKFIICGVDNNNNMEYDVKNLGMESAFEFKGFVNIKDIISTFNVFGYPLNKEHYGTCEQVLGEVMACGVEPVVLNNPTEKYIVEGYGRVCNNPREYIESIVDIYNNPPENSIRLKERASELYDIHVMINKWNNIFNNMIEEEKKERFWSDKDIKNGYEIFIESLGEYGKILETGNIQDISELFNSNAQWRSKSKGSVHQYLEAFPDDKKLQEWSMI